jgi:gliding motility-associated-like protein
VNQKHRVNSFVDIYLLRITIVFKINSRFRALIVFGIAVFLLFAGEAQSKTKGAVLAGTIIAAGPQLTTTGTPSSVSTTYGTTSSYTTFTLSGANLTGPVSITPPAGFEVSTDGINFVSATTVAASFFSTPKTIYIRLSSAASAGTHFGNIDISTSGATDVQVAMPQSTVAPAQLIIDVKGTKTYGTAFGNFTGTAAQVDLSQFQNYLKNGEVLTSIDLSFTGGNNATDPAGTYTNAIHTANAQGTNGFLPANYSITYGDGDLVVGPATLTITAATFDKSAGATITGGFIVSGYAISGLQNGETITGVTVTYGNGAAANAPIGTYNGSVVLSNAVGGNGFLLSNYSITYVPAAIVVYASGPVVATSGNLSPLTTVYGTYSSAETFSVVASSLTSGVVITPPAGFEISTDDITYSATVTIGSGSTSVNQTIFIRLKATANAGTYSGNIVASSGSANTMLIMPLSTVVPAPLTLTAGPATKVYGTALAPGPGYLQFTIAGGSLQNGETISSVSVSYNLGDSTQSAVGVYHNSVAISQPVGPGTFLASNYAITYQTADLTVTPATLTVIANAQSRPYLQPNPPLTFKYSGFVSGDDSTVMITQPIASTNATPTSPVGQYPITVSGGSAANYQLVYVASTLTVTTIPGLMVTVPNTFTPNGDGINDNWNIANIGAYGQSHVQIFNRYGTLVYNSVGYSTPWDGNVNGSRAPDGTYYYVITLVPGGAPIAGYLTVLR